MGTTKWQAVKLYFLLLFLNQQQRKGVQFQVKMQNYSDLLSYICK